MARQTEEGIIWCDETWNPVRGCSPVSSGCANCWAARMASRFCCAKGFPYNGNIPDPYYGFVERTASGPQWTGRVELIESELGKPLHWRKPRRIGVGLMGDLFRLGHHDLDRIFAVMALCPQHEFFVLTKQAQPMYKYSKETAFRAEMIGIEAEYRSGLDRYIDGERRWEFPLLNVRMGISAEDQATLLERVMWLRKTPAAHRWLSLEPLLGAIDLSNCMAVPIMRRSEAERASPEILSAIKELAAAAARSVGFTTIDLVVVGGESGPGARPMHPDWVRQVRDQCQAAGVPFTFKQWGEWAPREPCHPDNQPMVRLTRCDGGDVWMQRVGKRAAGRMLDGRTWEGK